MKTLYNIIIIILCIIIWYQRDENNYYLEVIEQCAEKAEKLDFLEKGFTINK